MPGLSPDAENMGTERRKFSDVVPQAASGAAFGGNGDTSRGTNISVGVGRKVLVSDC